MKRLFRHIRLLVLTLVLAVVSLTVAATAISAVHAASQPSITAQGGEGLYAPVAGSGFTPGGKVLVTVYDANYHFLAAETVTASRNGVFCAGQIHICYMFSHGGAINATVDLVGHLVFPDFDNAEVHVVAIDLSTARWSNWSMATLGLLS